MQPVLPLFDKAEGDCLPIASGVHARGTAGTPPGIAYFHLAALKGVLPQWCLEGVDCDERVVVPGDAAMVVYACRAGVDAREMLWSTASTRTTSPWKAAWHHHILPRFGTHDAEQRAVVIVSRIGLKKEPSASASTAWLTSSPTQPIYLAGLWRSTLHGPEFTLLQQRSTGRAKMAASHMPVVIDDSHIWEWLLGRRLLVPLGAWFKQQKFSINLASNNAQESGT